MAQGRQLNGRLFLEGRSVPFVSASCTFTAGLPSTATIKVPPLPEIRKIQPRTMAQVFFRDFTYPGADKPWALLFEGEIYGYSLGKSSRDRSFDLYAMDYTNYWDNAKQFYLNVATSFGNSVDAFETNKQLEEATKENNSIKKTVTGIEAHLTKVISDKLKQGKDFLAAIIAGIQEVEEINPFFRYANARFRINDRLVFKSSGKIKELFDWQNKEDLLNSLIGKGNGGVVTVRQIVTLLMNFIFHDWTTVPCPSKVSTNLSGGIGSKSGQTIGSFVFKPNSFMMPPPKCNVLYPDQYSNFRFSRNFFHEITRGKYQRNLVSVEQSEGFPRSALATYYAPSGFQTFNTGTKVSTIQPTEEVEDTQFKQPIEQGMQFEAAPEDVKNTTVLQDFNFLSYEELIKGIFADQGKSLPTSQIFSKNVSKEDQQKLFQRASDYLFYKQRFASRGASASGPFNPAVVPGFPFLVLDDSGAEQNVIGVLESVTHQISATQGGFSSYNIGYSRCVDEVDTWDGDLFEPPVPPWYDTAVFGQRRTLSKSDYGSLAKDDQAKVKAFTKITGFEGTSIKDYYLGLLGNVDSSSHLGAEPIVNEKFPNMYSATLALIQSYRTSKRRGDIEEFISKQTRRDYVLLSEHFSFLGAAPRSSQQNVDTSNSADIVFSGGLFDGGFVSRAADKENSRDRVLKTFFQNDVTRKRREAVDAYRKRLLTERGFRG